MMKRLDIVLILIMPFCLYSQQAELSPDFRQHNLTVYNANLFDPVFSLDRNEPRSLALWTRWQWQTIDGDPTTLLFNYTHRLNVHSAGGLGFFQHNTGLFLETGAVLNYAYNFELGGGAELALGMNAFGYQRKPSDQRFQANPNFPLPQFDVPNDFILQLAPALRFRYKQFSAGIVGENLLDYNITDNEQDSGRSDRIYLGHMSYRIPVYIFGSSEDSYIRPTLYMKTLPGMDDQYGMTGLFSTPKFWAQLGYNSLYGTSGGVGGRFFQHFSIGALVEFGTNNSINNNDTTFEFVTAYNFGTADLRKRVIGFEPTEEQTVEVPKEPKQEVSQQTRKAEAVAERAAEARAEKVRDSLAKAKAAEELLATREVKDTRRARKIRERDSLAAAEQERQFRQRKLLDSIAQVRREEALAAARKQEEESRRDSLAAEKAAEEQLAQEEVSPEPGEKYEETTTEEGLAPGYYLIANVFGTKTYYEAFMKNLSEKGLEPKSFYRSVRKYNYVYLQRYDSIKAARAARDSKLNGRYSGDLWIFRVVGK